MRALVLGLLLASSVQPGEAIVTGGRPDHFFSWLRGGPLSLARQCTGVLPNDDQGNALTFVRNSDAWCQRSDGLLVQLTAHQPIIEQRGAVIHGFGSQRLLNSNRLNLWTAVNVTVTTDGANGPDGTATAEVLTTTSPGGYVESASITGAAVMKAMGFFKTAEMSGRQDATLVIWDTVAGAAACTQNFSAVTTYPMQEERTGCFTTTATAANAHTVRIYPGGLAGSGELHAWGLMIQNFSNAMRGTVVSAGTAANYPIEQLYASKRPIVAQGCVAVTVTVPTVGLLAAHGDAVVLASATGTNFMNINNSTFTGFAFYDQSAHIASVGGLADIRNRAVRVTAVWGADSKQVFADGIWGSSNLFDGTWGAAADAFWIGIMSSGGGAGSMGVRDIVLGENKTGCRL